MVAISARNTKVYKICKAMMLVCYSECISTPGKLEKHAVATVGHGKAIFSAFFTTFRNQTLHFTHFSMLFLAVVICLHLLA
jgi:hypothetical protein